MLDLRCDHRDGEPLYDPGVYHSRLLLGPSGIVSAPDLHQIRLRLHQGERQKAARGELRLPLPAGLAYAAGGEIILNPSEEVHARLRFVFSTFQALQSAKAVMQHLSSCPAGTSVMRASAREERQLCAMAHPLKHEAEVSRRHTREHEVLLVACIRLTTMQRRDAKTITREC